MTHIGRQVRLTRRQADAHVDPRGGLTAAESARSIACWQHGHERGTDGGRSRRWGRVVGGGDERQVAEPTARHGATTRRVGHVQQGDRKSTRLNSSHMSISYAVFCLKKKTNNRLRTGIFTFTS